MTGDVLGCDFGIGSLIYKDIKHGNIRYNVQQRLSKVLAERCIQIRAKTDEQIDGFLVGRSLVALGCRLQHQLV